MQTNPGDYFEMSSEEATARMLAAADALSMVLGDTVTLDISEIAPDVLGAILDAGILVGPADLLTTVHEIAIYKRTLPN